MALVPLATVADLSARGIDITNAPAVDAVLAAASAAVRDGAGCAITRETSTVSLLTSPNRRVALPARPVVSVASVALDGVALVAGTHYALRGSSLWSLSGEWRADYEIPGDLVVTFTHGLAEVPADVIDLVCSLAGAGIAASSDGYTTHAGLQYESIDDYRVGYATGADAVASVMELPERTKSALRLRFSGSTTVVGSAR